MFMPTTHFAANWKNRPERGIVGLCQKFAMRQPNWSKTTTNRDEVDCKSCAKSLGITPAAKVKAANLGTCPCCFNEQKTLKGERMVHHGYQRPGYGYIVGDCFGVKYPRFEISCEGTIAYKACIALARANVDRNLTKLLAGGFETLPFNYTVYVLDTEGNRTWTSGTAKFAKETVYVNVAAGDKRVTLPYTRYDGAITIPSYQDLFNDTQRTYERQIKTMDGHMAELAEKIQNWKPALDKSA
jgi:hypothetical protein